MDETIESTPEPAKPAAVSRAGAKALKRAARKAKKKTPKPSKSMRGTVRP